MNSFFGIILFLTANLMLVKSVPTKTSVNGKADVLDMVPLPPMLSGLNMTVPGTKWCGLGIGSATDLNDLGPLNNTDLCCRDHQLCEEIIEPISSAYTLENPTLLPKFNCKCEQELYECLKEQNDLPSIVFGQAYFGVMEQCFAKSYPITKCVQYQTAPAGLGKRCVKYAFDETKQPKYQYFDQEYFIN